MEDDKEGEVVLESLSFYDIRVGLLSRPCGDHTASSPSPEVRDATVRWMARVETTWKKWVETWWRKMVWERYRELWWWLWRSTVIVTMVMENDGDDGEGNEVDNDDKKKIDGNDYDDNEDDDDDDYYRD